MSAYELVVAALLTANAILLAVVVRHLRTPKPSAAATPPATAPQLSTAERTKLEQVAATAFTAAVEQATNRFGTDLDGTSERLNQLIVRLTTEVVERELEQYRQSLAAARTKALDSLTAMQQAIEQREQSLQSGVDAELTKRRDFLLARLDAKLGEAASAYIVESLGNGADLGAQRSFLIDSLERHKADLKQEFADES